MAKIDPQKFWEIYRTLPDDLQKAIFSDDVQDTIDRICERYGILDLFDFISDKSGDVYLGFLKPVDFLAAVKNELKTDPVITAKIIADLNDYLLRPVGDSLAKLYELTPQIKTIPPQRTTPAAATPSNQLPKIPQSPNPTIAMIPKAAPMVAPIIQRQKPAPASAAIPTKPARPVVPRTAQPRPAIQPQTPGQPQDGPTLSAAPGGLRRKVF